MVVSSTPIPPEKSAFAMDQRGVMSPAPPQASGRRMNSASLRSRTVAIANDDSVASAASSNFEDEQEPEAPLQTMPLSDSNEQIKALQRNIEMLTNMRRRDALVIRELKKRNNYLEEQNQFLQRKDQERLRDMRELQDSVDKDEAEGQAGKPEHDMDASENGSVKTEGTRTSGVQWRQATMNAATTRRFQDLSGNNAKLKQELLKTQAKAMNAQAALKELEAKARDYDQYKGLAESKLKSLGIEVASAARAQDDLLAVRSELEDCRAELKEAQHHSIAQTHKHASDIESLQGSKDELESNLEALRDSLVDAKFELKRTKAEKQRLADDKVAVLRDLAALKQHFKAEGAESLELAQRLEDFEKEREQQQMQIVENLVTIDNLQADLDHHKVQLATYSKKLEDSEKRGLEVANQRCFLSSELDAARTEAAELRKVLDGKDSELAESCNRAESLGTSNSDLEEQVASLKGEIAELKRLLVEAKSTVKEQESEIEVLHEQISQLEDEKDVAEARSMETVKSLATAHEQMAALREALSSLREEYSAVREQLSKEQKAHDEDRIMRDDEVQGLVEQLRATEKDLADVAAEKDGSFAAYEKLVAENEQLLRQVDGLQDTNISEENEVSELKLRMAQMEADYLAETDELRAKLGSASVDAEDAVSAQGDLVESLAKATQLAESLAQAEARADEAEAALKREEGTKTALAEKSRNAEEIVGHANETCDTIKLSLATMQSGDDDGDKISIKEAQLLLGGVVENFTEITRLLDQLRFHLRALA
jgi:chromosome segregation ATPase